MSNPANKIKLNTQFRDVEFLEVINVNSQRLHETIVDLKWPKSEQNSVTEFTVSQNRFRILSKRDSNPIQKHSLESDYIISRASFHARFWD